MATVSDLKRRLESVSRWMKVLEDGLNGHPHDLGVGEGEAMEKALAKLGIRLLSETKARKEGLVLRRGARNVVRRYYGAPISRFGYLYVLEQFRPVASQQNKSTS